MLLYRNRPAVNGIGSVHVETDWVYTHPLGFCSPLAQGYLSWIPRWGHKKKNQIPFRLRMAGNQSLATSTKIVNLRGPNDKVLSLRGTFFLIESVVILFLNVVTHWLCLKYLMPKKIDFGISLGFQRGSKSALRTVQSNYLDFEGPMIMSQCTYRS